MSPPTARRSTAFRNMPAAPTATTKKAHASCSTSQISQAPRTTSAQCADLTYSRKRRHACTIPAIRSDGASSEASNGDDCKAEQSESCVIELTQISNLLQLPVERFLSLSRSDVEELQSRFADIFREYPSPSRLDPVIVASFAPTRVDSSRSVRLPILVASHGNSKRQWEVSIAANSWILAKDGATGELHCMSPDRPDGFDFRPRGSRPGPYHQGPHVYVTSAGVRLFDVGERLAERGKRLQPGRVYTTALEYDLRSDTAVTIIEGPTPTPAPAPEIPEHVEHRLDGRADLTHHIEVSGQEDGPGGGPVVSVSAQVDEQARCFARAEKSRS